MSNFEAQAKNLFQSVYNCVLADGEIDIDDKKRLIIEIEEALSSTAKEATRVERERLKKVIADLDPLKALCKWEDGDDIAYAVRDYILTKIRNSESEAQDEKKG